MTTLRDTDQDLDISNIDPNTVRKRPSLGTRPTFVMILMSCMAVVSLLLAIVPSVLRQQPLLSPLAAVGIFGLGLALGGANAWLWRRDLQVRRDYYARVGALRWPRGLLLGKPNWAMTMGGVLSVVAVLGVAHLFFPLSPSRVVFLFVAGLVIPGLSGAKMLHEVHKRSWQIIRQVKAKPEGEE